MDIILNSDSKRPQPDYTVTPYKPEKKHPEYFKLDTYAMVKIVEKLYNI
jgi:hypothetical protein